MIIFLKILDSGNVPKILALGKADKVTRNWKFEIGRNHSY